MLNRINNPPVIIQAKIIHFDGRIQIGDRPFKTYIVVDSFHCCLPNREYIAILCLEATADLLQVPMADPAVCFVPIPGYGIYNVHSRVDIRHDPKRRTAHEQILPGDVSHHIAQRKRLSVLFWKDEFWAPLQIESLTFESCFTSAEVGWKHECVQNSQNVKETIAKFVYGEKILETHTFDIVQIVKVSDIPDVDLLRIKDPVSDTWTIK